MPFDEMNHGGGGGGGKHRVPTAEHCQMMHGMLEAFAEEHGLCMDCVMAKMGAGLLANLTIEHALKDGRIDSEELTRVTGSLITVYLGMLREGIDEVEKGHE
jgi:hypothetical protein